MTEVFFSKFLFKSTMNQRNLPTGRSFLHHGQIATRRTRTTIPDFRTPSFLLSTLNFHFSIFKDRPTSSTTTASTTVQESSCTSAPKIL